MVEQSARIRLVISGQVQGVGFRPHVYHLARMLSLTGWVQNNAEGVVIEIQGMRIGEFKHALMRTLPPLATVDNISSSQLPRLTQETDFYIRESECGKVRTIISPDTATCDDCLHELFNTESRYYHYPFLNCMHCGPRFTITRALPYDRAQTAMDAFPLCEACLQDYTNPLNRRYHAQPTACMNCGPALSLSINDIADKIARGEIVALKGLGGYQLICDATNKSAVMRLRERKQRDAKPFALMVANLESACHTVSVSPAARALLLSKARPIVLLRRLSCTLPDSLAPGLSHLGIMLPSTPIHYLLFHALAGSPKGDEWLVERQASVLVVTSANRGGDPLIIDDDAAKLQLSTIADTIVSYNRKIVMRADDSVLRLIHDTPCFIRRARGFVPSRIRLKTAIPVTLALGGHLKNTFCITRGDEAFLSQHLGSLNNKATIDFFHESLSHMLKLLDVEPERIAHDYHPDFYTSHLASEWGLPTYAIQHHHAHLAAVAAEYQVQGPVLGMALDGYGYGLAGEAWGGELCYLQGTSFKRLACLLPLPALGGDQLAREPWRMAAAVMHTLGRGSDIYTYFADQSQAKQFSELLKRATLTSQTSSAGRLFDAACALLKIRNVSQYEGQAPMLLESLVTQPQVLENGFRIMAEHLDLLPILKHLMGLDPVTGANLFHGTLIAGLAEWVRHWSKRLCLDTVLLSGGCFLNQVLTEGLINALADYDIKALLPRKAPPNDGGLSLGQAWLAGQM